MRFGSTASGPTGFTLVELLAGIAILGVLIVLALPSYARFMADQQLLNEARRIAEGITLARSEAIKRNGHVVICGASAGAACDVSHWHAGWVVFEDRDHNAEIDAGDAILGTERASPPDVTAVGNGPVSSYLRFNFMGQARMVGGALQMGTIEVCKPGLVGYRVVLANSGRTRIDRSPGTCL